MKLDLIGIQELHDRLAVKLAQIQNADLTAQICHIVNDLPRLCLFDRKFVLGSIHILDHLHKCLDRKRIMLRRHAEFLFDIP